MRIKGLIDEDFLNYKKPSMFIIFPKCNFKCCKEAGYDVCQNIDVIKQPTLNVSNETIINRYLSNPITKAIVCGGLEPIDSYEELIEFLGQLRKVTDDDVVIYTGYNESELEDELACLAQYKNIIVKFGRFIPNNKRRFNEVLGVEIYEPQYAEKIS